MDPKFWETQSRKKALGTPMKQLLSLRSIKLRGSIHVLKLSSLIMEAIFGFICERISDMAWIFSTTF